MHVPPGGGPPPHRHDFEEMFTVLDGEVQMTTRTQAPPPLDAAARAAFIAKSRALTPDFKTELLRPPGAK